jgi:hypothetical protein
MNSAVRHSRTPGISWMSGTPRGPAGPLIHPQAPLVVLLPPPAPYFVEALARLRARSCILDGEAVACGDDGIAVFELIRDWRNGDTAFLYAFDLIELNGNDLRRNPLEVRKATLAQRAHRG